MPFEHACQFSIAADEGHCREDAAWAYGALYWALAEIDPKRRLDDLQRPASASA